MHPEIPDKLADSKIYPFIVELKNESSRYVNITGLILSIGSAALFLREMVLLNRIVIPYLAGIVFIAGLIIYNIHRYYTSDKEIYHSKALLIAGLVWTRMPYFEWLVVVFAGLAILEYQAKMAPEIGFSEDGIVFNRLFRKKHRWDELENVIIKDGLLTIDFKNNRLFQKEISAGMNEAGEPEFNQWCAERLTRS